MSKKTTFTTAAPPKGNRPAAAEAEAFFDNLPNAGTPGAAPQAAPDVAPAQRITLDVPAGLQRSMKAAAENQPEREPTQRLTLDIPASLHRAIKAAAALNGTNMKDDVSELLERHYRPANT